LPAGKPWCLALFKKAKRDIRPFKNIFLKAELAFLKKGECLAFFFLKVLLLKKTPCLFLFFFFMKTLARMSSRPNVFPPGRPAARWAGRPGGFFLF
jgi:hypothetical protein